jgi:hypothetical protein
MTLNIIFENDLIVFRRQAMVSGNKGAEMLKQKNGITSQISVRNMSQLFA